jgi:hypothetical protein
MVRYAAHCETELYTKQCGAKVPEVFPLLLPVPPPLVQLLLSLLGDASNRTAVSPVVLGYEEAQVPGFFFGIDETGEEL